VFLGGFTSNLVVAVTSFGPSRLCRGVDFGYRIDCQEDRLHGRDAAGPGAAGGA